MFCRMSEVTGIPNTPLPYFPNPQITIFKPVTCLVFRVSIDGGNCLPSGDPSARLPACVIKFVGSDKWREGNAHVFIGTTIVVNFSDLFHIDLN